MSILNRLHKLEDALLKHFPDLSHEINADQEFLHMWKFCSQGLQYLPNFHLIFQAESNETMIAKIISYHGRTIDTLILNDSDVIMNKDLVQHFVTEFYEERNVCQGVSCTDANGNLVEFFNDSVVARSSNCHLKLNHCSSELQCEECQKLLDSKGDFQVKLESFEDESYNQEEEEYDNDAMDVKDFMLTGFHVENDSEPDHFSDEEYCPKKPKKRGPPKLKDNGAGENLQRSSTLRNKRSEVWTYFEKNLN